MSSAAFLDISPTSASDIPIGRVRPERVRKNRKSWVQWCCAALIVGTILLSPLPRAGNHPLAWMFWTSVFSASATLLNFQGSFASAIPGRIARRILILGAVFVGFSVFQALPIPAIRGSIPVDFPQISVPLQHLSIAPSATMLGAFRISGYLIFFTLVLFVARDAQRAKTVGFLTFYSVAAHGLFAIISLKLLGDTGLAGPKPAFHGAATGAFLNKNSFATFLGMGLVLGLSLMLSELARRGSMRRFEVLAGLASLGVIGTALLLTQSRMGIAASLVGVAFVLFASKTGKSARLAVVVFACLTALAMVPGLLQTGFFYVQVSAQTRFELYQQILGMIANRPLVGFGLDSFALAFEPFHAPPVTPEFVWDKGHSSYLTLWAEAGLVFGSIPPLIGLAALIGLWARVQIPARGRSLALAGLGVLVLGGLHSLVDFSLEIQANMLLLITIVGLGLGHDTDNKGKS